jgi:hypothetical protein
LKRFENTSWICYNETWQIESIQFPAWRLHDDEILWEKQWLKNRRRQNYEIGIRGYAVILCFWAVRFFDRQVSLWEVAAGEAIR